MKKFFCFLGTILCLGCTLLSAADRLAIVSPRSKGGVSDQELDMFWSMLESSIPSDEYEVVSRSAMKQMLSEMNLQNESGLVNLTPEQSAKLGKMASVKYILISEIGKFGSKYNCTMRIMDAATGRINNKRKVNLRVANMDELADRLEEAMTTLFTDPDPKALKQNRYAVLLPIVKVENVPEYFPETLNTNLQSILLNSGYTLQNLNTVKKVCEKNGFSSLTELTPKQYSELGRHLQVEHLIQVTVLRFEITVFDDKSMAEMGLVKQKIYGNMEIQLKVLETKTGNIEMLAPLSVACDFSKIPKKQRKGLSVADYGRMTINAMIEQQIKPALANNPKLKR